MWCCGHCQTLHRPRLLTGHCKRRATHLSQAAGFVAGGVHTSTQGLCRCCGAGGTGIGWHGPRLPEQHCRSRARHLSQAAEDTSDDIHTDRVPHQHCDVGGTGQIGLISPGNAPEPCCCSASFLLCPDIQAQNQSHQSACVHVTLSLTTYMAICRVGRSVTASPMACGCPSLESTPRRRGWTGCTRSPAR